MSAPPSTSPTSPVQVLYLLEDTALFGGVKVVLCQANLLHRRGHRVTVATKGEPPAWYPLEAELVHVPSFSRARLPAADVTVATYWTTIFPALEAAGGEVVHYCQGFEAEYTHNADEHPAILDAYRQPLPALTVSPHLGDLLRERFGRPSRLVAQPLEEHWRPVPGKDRPSSPARVLLVGPFEIDWKGIKTGLEALRLLRRGGHTEIRVVRLSQWPLSDEEKALLEPDELHVHLRPSDAAELVRGCDLLLAPSWEQEGFGLPVLEAMASGVPVIASDIAAFRWFAAAAAQLAPPHDAEAWAAAAEQLLGSESDWRRRREAGLSASRAFEAGAAAESAETALRWVLEGTWRKDLEGRLQ